LWGVFLLAGVLLPVLSHHFTFLINSAAHAFGRQPNTDAWSCWEPSSPELCVLTMRFRRYC
jgi:fatty-acid desaturase